MPGLSRENDRARRSVPGRANTVLVLEAGKDDKAVAVVSQVSVTLERESGENCFTFRGSGQIDNATLRHYDEAIGPLLQRTAMALHLEPPGFEIAVTNLAAASLQNRPISVQGFSADLAVFLACLSRLLGVPLRTGVVSSGHIADPGGAVRMVGRLPAKLMAACACKGIDTILYPDPAGDDSIANLLPSERDDIHEALLEARNDLHLEPVCTVNAAVRAAFEESSLVLAALEKDYFQADERAGESSMSPDPSALTASLDSRFWECLREQLRDKRKRSSVLGARIHYHVRQGCYPGGFGKRLYRVLAAFPPGVRRSRVKFPLLDEEDVLSLARLAGSDDLSDVRHFIDAVYGDRFSSAIVQGDGRGGSEEDAQASAAGVQLRVLLSEMDPDNLHESVGKPIDEARGTYFIEFVTVESDQDCLDAVAAFYLHILDHTSSVASDITPDAVGAESLALLDRAFARRGGTRFALAEAQCGNQGRIRYVLDTLTEQLKAEQQEKHAARAFKIALSGLDYEGRVALVEEFIGLLRPFLPDELADAPPERFLDGIELLVRTYMNSVEQIRHTLRAM